MVGRRLGDETGQAAGALTLVLGLEHIEQTEERMAYERRAVGVESSDLDVEPRDLAVGDGDLDQVYEPVFVANLGATDADLWATFFYHGVLYCTAAARSISYLFCDITSVGVNSYACKNWVRHAFRPMFAGVW